MKKVIFVALIFLGGCSSSVPMPNLESRVDGNVTQLVLVKADTELVLDQGIVNVVGNEGAADVKNFSDIQVSPDWHYAFVSVTGYEGRQADLYDLERGELVKSFPLASQSGFSLDGSTAFACASASAYGTYYVETFDLENKKVNEMLPMEGLNSEKAYSVECTTDEDSLNFTFTKDDEKEEYEYNYKEASLDKK